MTPATPRAGRQPLAAAALILVWLAATAWARPLMLPDEGRYAGVAWEMLRSGDWLTPTLNGLPYFHKPPLFYWITALSLQLFGLHAWAARAAPLLGAGAAALAVYLFVRRWWGEREARLALLVLLVQPLFYLGGQFANLDMLVAGCITVTTLLLADAALCLEAGRAHRRALAAAFAAAGLGVLAKGLIGAVIPALVIAAWLLARRRWRVLAGLLWWPAAVVFLLVAAPWFVAMQQRYAGFLDYFFVVQHFKRFTETGFNNAQPFWFYGAVLLLFCLPWLPWWGRVWPRGGPEDSQRSAVRLLMLVWVVVVVAFFSAPRSKLVGYVLPAVPPLSVLLAGGYASRAAPGARERRLWQAGAAVAALVGVATVVALSVHPLRSSRELGQALRQQRGPSEPVFLLRGYPFDLPFYARLREPVAVVDAWSAPDATQRDNWRKELADAAAFAPDRAATALISPEALPAALCRARVAWVVGEQSDASGIPVLAAARAVYRERDTVLWRVESTAGATTSAASASGISGPGCAGTPNAGSAGK